MKHSLDITLITNDTAKIQAVIDVFPVATDTTVWEEQYEISTIGLTIDGLHQATAMVRFHEDVGREAVRQAVLNVQSVLSGFDVGTKIQTHLCGHDEGLPCEVETVYEVVA